jgi:serine protease
MQPSPQQKARPHAARPHALEPAQAAAPTWFRWSRFWLLAASLASVITPTILVGLAGSSAALAPTSTWAAAPSQNYPAAAGRVIVRLRSNASLLAGSTHALALAMRPDQVAPMTHAATLGARLGLQLSDGHTVAPRTQVMLSSSLDSAELATRLSTDPDVEFAVPDVRRHALAAPNDPLYGNNLGFDIPNSGQWYLRAPDTTVLSSVNAEAAWAVTHGSAGVVVAMLDTGVRPDHPDLISKLLPGYDFISDASTANDGDGRDGDPSDPGDWITIAENGTKGSPYYKCLNPDDPNDPPAQMSTDSSWHGTQTAGLVGAATNNRLGMAGLGRNVLLVPVRVLGKCGGFDSDIVAAMQWAGGITVPDAPINQHPAKVINLSLGSPASCSTDPALNPLGANGAATAKLYVNAISALNQRGVAVVVSAGNDGLGVNLPADCAGAIAVSSLRHSGTKNGFSSLGPEVAISAPGGNCPSTSSEACQYPMLSTKNSGLHGPAANRWSTSIDSEVGTSFAAPLVSATVALMFSANPALTPAQVKQIMQSSARPFPTTGGGDPQAPGPFPGHVPKCIASSTEQTECYCSTSTCGAGMLDAGAALRAVAALVTVPTFSSTPDYPVAGDTVALDASAIVPPSGQSIRSLDWTITEGSGIASFAAGAANAGNTATTHSGPVATLVGSGLDGFVTVQLSVSDSAGAHVVSQRLAFGNVSNSITSASSSASKSGGGALAGPLSLAWLGGLLLAVLALARVQRRDPH